MKSYSVGQTVKTHGATGAVISGKVSRIENSGNPGREVVYWVDFGGGDVRPVKASEVVESLHHPDSSPETVSLVESLLRPLNERDEFNRRWGKGYLRVEVMEAYVGWITKDISDNMFLIRMQDYRNASGDELNELAIQAERVGRSDLAARIRPMAEKAYEREDKA